MNMSCPMIGILTVLQSAVSLLPFNYILYESIVCFYLMFFCLYFSLVNSFRTVLTSVNCCPLLLLPGNYPLCQQNKSNAESGNHKMNRTRGHSCQKCLLGVQSYYIFCKRFQLKDSIRSTKVDTIKIHIVMVTNRRLCLCTCLNN